MRTRLILLSLLLSSCSYVSVPVLAPYKMDIRQGNYVTAEMREKLRPGMTRAQVRYVLGTPLVNDAFHGNRWDYAYRLAQSGELVEKQHLALYFEDDRLVRAEEDGKPVQLEVVAAEEPKPVAPTQVELPVIAAMEAAKPAAPAAEAPVTQAAAQASPKAEMPAMEEAKPVAPVVAAPVTQTELKAEVPATPADTVLDSVYAWAAAWSSKDVRAYLAAYAPDYRPQNMSREVWEKLRVENISKPKVIEVLLSEGNVVFQDDSHATVTFRQSYRSNLYRDNRRKTLKLEKVGGAWLIVYEQVEK